MVPVPPAVVVGAELNGLGVVRSLAQGGVPVVIVDTSRRRAGMWSRHGRAVLVARFDGRPFVDELLSLARRLDDRPVLLLTDEFAVHAVSEHRAALAPHYRFRLPGPGMVEALGDKTAFQRLAERHGFPVPRTAVLSRGDGLSALDGLAFPIVVKPADKRHVLLGRAERARRVATRAEAEAWLPRLLEGPGTWVAQEWASGPDSNIHFCLFYRGRGGETVGLFTGRKLRAHPPEVGSTAICVPAPEARALLEPLTRAILDRVGFDGMGSLEFKWDEARRRFVIIEPTVGRTDWQEEVATLNGVNLPLLAYRHELGLPPPADPAPGAPVAWQASFAQRVPRGLLPPGARVVNGYWRLADPGPALFHYVLAGAARRLAAVRAHGPAAGAGPSRERPLKP